MIKTTIVGGTWFSVRMKSQNYANPRCYFEGQKVQAPLRYNRAEEPVRNFVCEA